MVDTYDLISGCVKAIKRIHPELRFDQILFNVCDEGNIFYFEDEKVLEALEKYLYNLNREGSENA
jgi:hypothetical protein